MSVFWPPLYLKLSALYLRLAVLATVQYSMKTEDRSAKNSKKTLLSVL